MSKLAITLLAPLVLGKFVRESSERIQQFTTTYKVELGLTNNTALLVNVWLNLSASRNLLIAQSASDVFGMFFAVIVQHCVFLLFNFLSVTYLLRLDDRARRSCIIMASQKTLPGAVTVIAFLPQAVVGLPALVAIPCILAHVSQLLIDAFITNWYSSRPPVMQIDGNKVDDDDGVGEGDKKGVAADEDGVTIVTTTDESALKTVVVVDGIVVVEEEAETKT